MIMAKTSSTRRQCKFRANTKHKMQRRKQRSPDHSDYHDDQVYLDEELINVVRNNNLQEEKKVEEIKGLLEGGANINFQDANNKNNTPLHIALHREELNVIELLVKQGAKIDIENDSGTSPLDLAVHCKKPDIVEILESGIKSNGNGRYNRQSSNQQRQLTPEQSQKRYKCSKRPGTTGAMEGHYYEIDLLILGKLRGEKNTDKFYLSTNVKDVGAFDDVVIRYWSSDYGKQESKIILLQAKHAENSKKSKVTIEKFINPKNDEGKFYLGKYLSDYLKSKEKFNDKDIDPVFNGNFTELDVRYIIYTNSILDEQFDKSRIVDAESNIFSTKSKDSREVAFKFRVDVKNHDLIENLECFSFRGRIKSLAKALVSCICGKPNFMMSNDILYTYHVFLSKNVIEIKEEKKKDEKGTEYREAKLNHNFLEKGNNDEFQKNLKDEVLYEYAERVVFSKESSLQLGDKRKRDNLFYKVVKSLKFSEDPDKKAIEKLCGSAIILDTKSRKLKFADENKLKDENTKEFIRELKSKVGDLEGYKFDIPRGLIEKVLMKNQPLKLPIDFGNISPTFKKPEHLIGQLIKLFKQNKSQKVIRIDDKVVGFQKILTDGDLKTIGKLVGNLLIFDHQKKMLRLVKEESLDGNVLDFFKKLKAAAQSESIDLDGYMFDIRIKKFPRDSLVTEEEDRINVEEFLSKLEIFTGQAGDAELKDIIKDELRDLYKLKSDEVKINFLEIRDKAEEFWKSGVYYLQQDDDLFTNILRFNIQFDMARPSVLFTGRHNELKVLHEILQNGSNAIISQIASLTGLGGIGKSELARKYISEYGNSYDGGLIWINARNIHCLTESFHKLAKNLEISIKDKEGDLKDIKFIVEDVYRFFTMRRSIFIFDDAEGYKDIKEFLPPFSYPVNKKPKILITSRNRDWKVNEEEEIKVISLGLFTPDEAEKFVEGFLGIKINSQKEDVKELTKQLQYLPLALRQAVAYIQEEDKRSNKRGIEKFEISNYLEKCRQQEKKLLDEDYYTDENSYSKTVSTTWIITLDKIAEDQRYGWQAIDILNIMAYFTPSKIDLRTLFSMSETDNRWNAVELLDQYSMVDLKHGVVDVHSLVQEVTRQNLIRENKEEGVLKKALQGIDNYKISEEEISHVISVWDYASKYPKLVSEICVRSRYSVKKDTPIHLFARSGNKEGLFRILEILPRMKGFYNKAGQTPLYEAIVNGNMEIVQCLIEIYNVNPNSVHKYNGQKSITVAALLGNVDLVKYFRNKGVNINSRTKNNYYTLDFAVLSGNKTLVKYLIDEGAKVNNFVWFGSTLHNALYSARIYGTSEDDILEIVRLLLQIDSHLIYSVDKKGRTPLHFSVQLGFTNIVELLLGEGADINSSVKPNLFSNYKDRETGFTALHIAANADNRKMLEILLKHGAYYDVKTSAGKTPLDFSKPKSDAKNILNCIEEVFKAVRNGKRDKVGSLLKEKPHNELEIILNARNTDGDTPELVARRMKKHRIAFGKKLQRFSYLEK